MSEFSGKCDLWDSLVGIDRVGNDSDWSKIEIWQGSNKLPISSLKDLIKYAPYLIKSSFGSKELSVYHIADEPCIDRQERESFEWKLKVIKGAYRRCKRDGREFIPKEVAEKYICFASTDDVIELCNRVKQHPYTNNVKGLHNRLHNFFRENWLQAMVGYGWSEGEARKWIYGK